MYLSHRVNKRVSVPFELSHYDVWGPCPVLSLIEFKYFITFVDDFSRVTWLYLMKSHYELLLFFFFLILVPFMLKFKHDFMSLFKHKK